MIRIILVLLFAMPCLVHAKGPEYTSSIKWVEERASTTNVGLKDRLYLAIDPGISTESAGILAYTNGITLRAVIDQSRYKDLEVDVTILRAKEPFTPVFHAVLKPKEQPAFKLLAGDVIWLSKARRWSSTS